MENAKDDIEASDPLAVEDMMELLIELLKECISYINIDIATATVLLRLTCNSSCCSWNPGYGYIQVDGPRALCYMSPHNRGRHISKYR